MLSVDLSLPYPPLPSTEVIDQTIAKWNQGLRGKRASKPPCPALPSHDLLQLLPVLV